MVGGSIHPVASSRFSSILTSLDNTIFLHQHPTTSAMPPELIPDEDEYASEEDSDFAPDAVVAEDKDASSDEESEAEDTTNTVAAKPKPKSAKRKRGEEEAEDLGSENSGDEAIIGAGEKERRKRKKKAKKGGVVDVEEDDEGGEGGLIKTRSQRAQEYVF